MQPTRAVIETDRPLYYLEGPDATLDRPGHVRAASGLAWWGPHLVTVQDDALFLSIVDPESAGVASMALAADAPAVRVFDDARGNKALKPDLESVIVIRDQHRDLIVGIGSGSRPNRERWLIVEPLMEGTRLEHDVTVRMRHLTSASAARWIDASGFYRAAREILRVDASELNLEGAAVAGGTVRFFQRGNGRRASGVRADNATFDVSREDLLRFVRGGSAPQPTNPRTHELGELEGVRLSFTDACGYDEHLWFLAAAENSPDTYRDGRVTGTVLGTLDAATLAARWTPIVEPDGRLWRGKAEGLALDPADPHVAYVVTDPDDPERSARLARLAIRGGARR